MPGRPDGRSKSKSRQAANASAGFGDFSEPGSSRGRNSQQRPQQQMELHFVNFDHPDQANARQHRKTIRSHVTRLQHQRKRAGTGATYKETKSDPLPSGPLVQGRAGKRKEREDEDGAALAYPTPESVDRYARDDDVEEVVRREPGFYQQVAMGRVDPFRGSEAVADWTIDIPSLIEQYLSRARGYMKSHGLAEEAKMMHPRLVQPRLYLDGFLFNALITLTTTRVAVVGDIRRADEPIVAWLRNNFLMTIRAAIKAGFDDRKVLAVGIALLIGWELNVGDPSTCGIHLKALPSVINAEVAPEVPNPDFDYGDRNKVAVFRGGRTIPSGFEFYRSQNLLPPTLMFHIGSLIYYDASAPGSSLWMRELWSSIGACAPVEETASKAQSARTLSSRIAQLVRQAGIMMGSFMRVSAGERPVAQSLRTGIQALWNSTLCDDWSPLIGTVYDEILLWCLCVFCTTSGYRDGHHVDAITRLLFNRDVWSLNSLVGLLRAYLCPPSMENALAELWVHMGVGRYRRDVFGRF